MGDASARTTAGTPGPAAKPAGRWPIPRLTPAALRPRAWSARPALAAAPSPCHPPPRSPRRGTRSGRALP